VPYLLNEANSCHTTLQCY